MIRFENMSADAEYHCKPPTNLDIFFIILLGICGMIGTFQYMLADLQVSGHKKELWSVQDLSRKINSENVITEDSLIVIYHPQVAAHPTRLKTEGLPDKQHLPQTKSTNSGNTLDFSSLYFAYNSVFLVWIAIFSILTGCSLALLPVILNAIKDIICTFRLTIRQRLLAVLVTVLIGALIYLSQHITYLMKPSQVLEKFHILLRHPGFLNIFIILAIAVALTGIAGQLYINQAIGKLPANIAALPSAEQNKIVDKFELLRSQLRFFLIIDAALIVLSILNTDAFRRAILAEISINMDIVPMNYVYLYGVLFTFFLGIIYMPIYYRLRYKGETMLKEIQQCPPETYNQEIVKVFKIQETPIESVKVVLSILAPVLTSLVPGLLNL